MGVWIPVKCTRTECRLLFRADSISDYSTQYCLNHLQKNMVRCLENIADHPNNEGVSWVGLNWIDYSWQISSAFCLRNYTQWRKIRIPQWYHALNWTVQFTWPHTCEASYSWVTMNVRYICRMWVLEHGRTTRMWPKSLWVLMSVASNYNPQKNESELITYKVCCGQTELTTISSSLHHTHVYVWQWIGLHINTIAIIVISAAGGAEEGTHSPHLCPLSHQIGRV